jgi:hypothetical protein
MNVFLEILPVQISAFFLTGQPALISEEAAGTAAVLFSFQQE